MATREQVYALRDECEDFLFSSIKGIVGVGGSDRLRIYVVDEHTKKLLEKLFAKEIDGIPVEITVTGRIVVH